MAWANFVDKNGDINNADNYIAGSLRGNKPDTNQIGDYWLINHPNWLEVSDSYVPPAPALTKNQQYDVINTQYTDKLTALSKARTQALDRGDTAAATKLQADIVATYPAWQAAIMVVHNKP